MPTTPYTMKPQHIFFAWLLLLCLSALSLTAQTTGNLKLSGSVIDSAAKQPLSFVTVSLTTPAGDPVKSTLTDNAGKFALAGLKAGKYHLVISAVGYKKSSTPVDLGSDGGKSTNIGEIQLYTDTKNLNEVKVTGTKPIVQQKPDRIVYDMQADPESKAKSVLEMLHKVPFVTVDANNVVNVKGSTNFKVYVNGKPSGAFQANLSEILKSMPASSIVRIEVITIPSSKYDAEGSGGIINIVTNRKIGDGYRGSVNANTRVPDGGTGVGGSFTLRSGKLGVNGYGGGNLGYSPRTTSSINQQNSGDTVTSLKQNGYGSSHGRSGYGGVEISYDIDTLHLLSGSVNVNGNHDNGTAFQSSTSYNNTGISQAYDITNHNQSSGKGVDASLNYQIGSKTDKDQLVTLSYQFSGYRNHSFANLDMANEINYDIPDHQQFNTQQVAEHTLQADFAKKVGKVGLDAGVKAIFRHDQSDYQYLNLDEATNTYLLDTAYSDGFNYHQNVYGAYAMGQFSLSKWNFNLGLRAEQTHADADFMNTGTFAKQNYLNLIPFVAINHPLDGSSNINISYTQRVRRPSVYRLNPFVDRSNPNYERTGNPDLKTVPMNDLQLNYSTDNGKGLSFFTAADFIYVHDLDLPITVFDAQRNVTTSTYANIGTGGGITWVLNINYSPVKAYRISLNSNMTYLHIDGRPGVAADRLRFLNPNVFLSNNYQFAHGWNASASFEYHGPNPASLQGRINSFFTSSFSVNKELVKNKFYLSASIDNPFSQYRYQVINTSGPNFYEHSVNQNNFRAFGLTATYNFGKLKDGVKKSRKEINNDDSFGSKGN